MEHKHHFAPANSFIVTGNKGLPALRTEGSKCGIEMSPEEKCMEEGCEFRIKNIAALFSNK